jgi:hypothetical protein
VNGRVHTNTIENFWSCSKRTLHGTYIAPGAFQSAGMLRFGGACSTRALLCGLEKLSTDDWDRFDPMVLSEGCDSASGKHPGAGRGAAE